MRKRPILLLAILSGCASSRPYVDPAGDLGAYDEDGHVYFSGRLTDMIKTAGANV